MIKLIKRISCTILIVATLLVVDILMLSSFTLADLRNSDTELTIQDLDDALISFEWTVPVEYGTFDCSNASVLLTKILQNNGFKACIATNITKHCWVQVKTKEGIQEVDPVWKYRYDSDSTKPTGKLCLSLIPALVKLVDFTGDYKYSENQYRMVGNETETDISNSCPICNR